MGHSHQPVDPVQPSRTAVTLHPEVTTTACCLLISTHKESRRQKPIIFTPQLTGEETHVQASEAPIPNWQARGSLGQEWSASLICGARLGSGLAPGSGLVTTAGNPGAASRTVSAVYDPSSNTHGPTIHLSHAHARPWTNHGTTSPAHWRSSSQKLNPGPHS